MEILDLDFLKSIRRPIESENGFLYFLFYKDVLVYVGKSDEHNSRVKNHRANKRQRKVFDDYSFVEYPKDSLLARESLHIKHYKPFYNGAENPDPKIKRMTYEWIGNSIFLNAGAVEDRLILEVEDKWIIEPTNANVLGFVIDGRGYIQGVSGYYSCKHGLIEKFKIDTMYDIDLYKPLHVSVSKNDYQKLKTAYDFYIYSKGLSLGHSWFTKECSRRGVEYIENRMKFVASIVAYLGFSPVKEDIKEGDRITHSNGYLKMNFMERTNKHGTVISVNKKDVVVLWDGHKHPQGTFINNIKLSNHNPKKE